tara:strand:- start:10255 stop:10455 length:201 start_codon:yes stop_codon:yes gene_type:complete
VKIGKTFSVLAVLMLFGHFSISNAFAYVDPGSGSAIIYVIISTLVGVGMTLKVYWSRIRHKLTSRE